MFGRELVPELINGLLGRLLLHTEPGSRRRGVGFVGHAGRSGLWSGDVNHVDVRGLGIHGQSSARLQVPRGRADAGDGMVAMFGGVKHVNKQRRNALNEGRYSAAVTAQAWTLGGVFSATQ